MKYRRLVATLLVCGVLAGACGDSKETSSTKTTVGSGTTAAGGATTTGAPAKPFVLALPVSKTGANAVVGQNFLNGLQIWVDMVNNNTGLYAGRSKPKGLLGRPVQLKFDDDQSKSDAAATLVDKYISQDKADFVFPPYGSGSVGVVAPIFAKNNYALIGATAAAESIYKTGLNNMVMSIAPTSKWLFAVPGIIQKQGYTSVSIVTLDNPATLDSQAYLDKQFAAGKISVKGKDTFPINTKDFSSIWTKVRSDNADVVILQAFAADAVTAMKQAAEQKVSPKMWVIFSGAGRNDVFLDGVGPAIADCIIGDQQWFPTNTTKGAKEFFDAYTKLYGDPLSSGSGVDASAAWAFVAGQLLTDALDALGDDGLKDQQKIIDYLKSGKVTETAIGRFGVDPQTGINTATEPGLFQFQNGKRVTIAPDAAAQGKPQLPCKPKG